MNPRTAEDEDEDDDLQYQPDDDEVVTVPCPHCRKPVWEEAPACEHCGAYLSREDAPWSKPWWWVLGGVAALIAVYLWITRAR